MGPYLWTGQLIDGTWGLLAGSAVSLSVTYALERRVAPLPLVLGILALLGTAALGFDPLKVIAGRLLTMADAAWRTLGLRLAVFNLPVALANLVIWRTQSDAVWAAFKFPGLALLHLAFLASQLPLITAGRQKATAEAPRVV